jgi:hypothetical protein
MERLRLGVSARTLGASCAGALWRCAAPEECVPLRGQVEGSLRRSACGGSGREPSSRLRQPRSARRPPSARRTGCQPACRRARRMRDVSRAPLLRRARALGRACLRRCLKAPACGKIRGEALIVSEFASQRPVFCFERGPGNFARNSAGVSAGILPLKKSGTFRVTIQSLPQLSAQTAWRASSKSVKSNLRARRAAASPASAI